MADDDHVEIGLDQLQDDGVETSLTAIVEDYDIDAEQLALDSHIRAECNDCDERSSTLTPTQFLLAHTVSTGHDVDVSVVLPPKPLEYVDIEINVGDTEG